MKSLQDKINKIIKEKYTKHYKGILDEKVIEESAEWLTELIHKEIIPLVLEELPEEIDATFIKFSDGKILDWVGIDGYNYCLKEIKKRLTKKE